MKKKQSTNGGKPVTTTDLKKNLKPIFSQFVQIDKQFAQIDKQFEIIDRRFVNVNMRLDNVEKALSSLQKEMRDQFNALYNHIDAFMKRTETNEQEILFLGKQHDDLAKYCTQKIAYPTYGRNL